MRKISTGGELLTVASLCDLDALVGEIVMEEGPKVHWEDSDARFQFDSLDEALDLYGDPVLLGFVSENPGSTTVLKEVHEYRPYSTTLPAAWEVVDRFPSKPLQLRREGRDWFAAFGDHTEVKAGSAELAICLAALRTCGCEVQLVLAAGE